MNDFQADTIEQFVRVGYLAAAPFQHLKVSKLSSALHFSSHDKTLLFAWSSH
jgi:hypothetical protein